MTSNTIYEEGFAHTRSLDTIFSVPALISQDAVPADE